MPSLEGRSGHSRVPMGTEGVRRQLHYSRISIDRLCTGHSTSYPAAGLGVAMVTELCALPGSGLGVSKRGTFRGSSIKIARLVMYRFDHVEPYGGDSVNYSPDGSTRVPFAGVAYGTEVIAQ